jgi:hypothetical protein
MKGFLPPRALALARASAARASRPLIVPATAYWTPARLWLTIWRNSPVASEIERT